MNSPIKAAMSWFTRKFQEIVGDLPKDIQTEINNKVAPQQAVNNSFKKQGIFGKLRQRVTEVIEKAAGIGLGQKPKPMPELYTSWDASKMRLSEKLHGTDAKMRAAIVDTIREQLKLGKHAKEAALALYDGYNSGKHVVRRQELPLYMQKIINLARRGELTDDEKAALQRLIRRAEAQTAKMGAKGAPNKALKTAYNELLNAVNKGAGKALERGIKTAVEEKSRYVAERIARTEAARAWAEAFHARYKDDDEVLAYKWQLGSRHPNFDVCDMYAEANLYGLGKGIFPKDKCPALPAHPHCLCHLTPVYKGETDLTQKRDNVKQGGDAWLMGLTYAERCKVLGIDGAAAFEHDAGDWRESMRGYSPETLGTRLTEAAGRGKMNKSQRQGGEIKIDWPKYDKSKAFTAEQYNDLRNFAKDHDIDISGFKGYDGDIDTIKESIKTLSALQQQFPKVADKQHKLTLIMARNMDADDFAITTKGRFIYLNANAYRDKNKLRDEYKKLVDDGWFVKGTDYRAIIHHEFGHIVAKAYHIDPMKIAQQITGKRGFQLINQMQKDLSGYSASDYDGTEIISEVFADISTGAPTVFSRKFYDECVKLGGGVCGS